MLLIKIKKTKKRFRAYPTHQAVQTTGSTALIHCPSHLDFDGFGQER